MVLIKETGPEMFWGIRLNDGKRYSQTVEASFHISMAAIDSSTKDTEPTTVMISHKDVEYVLCTLQRGILYQQQLDLNFIEGESLTLYTKGKGPVYLTGYRVYDQEDDDNDLTDDAVERYRQEHAHDGLGDLVGDSDEESSEEEEESEEESEEEEEQVKKAVPITANPKKRKVDAAGDAPASKKSIMDLEAEEDDSEDDEDYDDESGEDDSEDSEDLTEEDEDEDDDDDEEEDSEDDSDGSESGGSMDEDDLQKLVAQLEKAKPNQELKPKQTPQTNGGKTPEKKPTFKTQTPKQEQKTPVKAESGKKSDKTPQAKTEQSSKKQQSTPKSSQIKTPDSQKKGGDTKKKSNDTPKRSSDTPKKGSDTPKKGSDTPKKGSDTPKKSSDTPKKGSDTPKGNDTPKANGQTKKAKTVTLSGGVLSTDKIEGHGPVAKPGKMVHMYYVGKLQNGKQFDATTSGPAFKFRLGKQEVIKGWDVGVVGMKVGGKRTLTIPAPMAYGGQSIPGIPKNSTLVFDVELRAVS